MDEFARSPLAAWETFFFLVGSSGAALTGLQFVVIALIAESRRRATTREIEAFGTPTIIHFCAVLLIAALVSAPWRGLFGISACLGLCGILGLGYGAIVLRRAQRQTTYRPVFEDWLWHTILPNLAYAVLIAAAIFLRSHPHRSLFLVGAASLVLLFTGIHNAWDTVTYIAISQQAKADDE